MSSLYCICTLLLIISAILLKKTEKKLDIIKTITIAIVLFVCYQTFISYICTIVHIPITLLSLTLINLAIAVIIIAKIIHQNQMQIYYVEKKDFVFITILACIVFAISYFDFGFPLEIKYLTTDSAIHYISAREFYENESLLSNVKNIDTANAMMPGAYSNIGILFKVFSPWIGEMNLYKVFIGFDIVMLFLAGLLFYETIKKYAKSKISTILAGIVSIIYLLGYPLNNLLFGYFYLGIGVLVINAILLFMQEGFFEEVKKHIKVITLFLLCFGLFFSYYLFAPAIYGAIFIFYVIYFKKQNNKWISKDMVIYTIITLAIPTILGFCYHVLPGMLSPKQIQVGNVIQVEGYIYRNLYSNLLLFVPFLVYYLMNEKKEKKINFDIIAFIILIAYMCVLYIGIYKLNISTYYFYKTYFAMWQLVIYLFYRGICYFIEDIKYGKHLATAYIAIYILLMIYSLFNNQVQINKSTQTNEKITDVMDIYGLNKTILFDIMDDYNTKELEILNYIKDNNIEVKDKNTLILGNQRQEYWFWAILKYRYKDNLNYATSIEDIESWNNGEFEYIVYFNRSENYTTYEQYLDTTNSERLYENEAGTVLQNKVWEME